MKAPSCRPARRTLIAALGAPAVIASLMLAPASVGSPGDGKQPANPTPPPVIKADRDNNKVFDDLEARLAGQAQSDRVEVIVRLADRVTADRLAALERAAGALAVSRRFTIIDGFAATLTRAQIEALSRRPDVVSVEENSRVRAFNDGAQSSFGVAKARADLPTLDGNADGAQATYSKDDLVAAVIDTGVHPGHLDLDEGKILAFKDFVNGRTDAYDDEGHGTHVAATIAGDGDARADGLHKGVAPDAALVGVKVLDSTGAGDMAVVVSAIEWVVQNKDVYGIEAINLSLGSSGCSDGTDAASVAVNNAHAAGLVVAVAAGNEGPGSCTIGSPAAAKDALTVGAMVDMSSGGFRQASFSSRGKTADGRIKPDISAPGANITSAQTGTTNGYVTYSGTSMATPFTAGVALLMRDHNAGLTPQQIKTTLMSTAIDWGRGGDNKTAGTTGIDIDYGAGRMDAYAALKSAGAALAEPPPMPTHVLREGTLSATGSRVDYTLAVTDTRFPISATMIIPGIAGASAASPDFDLFLYDPAGVKVAASERMDRQEALGFQPTATGTYTLRVYSYAGSGSFFVDISAGLVTDAVAPTVTGTSPADAATGVAASTNVSVTFSEPMSQAATQAAFSLVRSSDGTAVAGALSWSGNTLTLDPTADLAAGTQYTAKVTTAAKDLAGNALAAEKVWRFTTVGDSVAPTVTGTSPAGGTTGVAAGTNVSVTFSEPMDQAAAQGAFSLVKSSDGTAVTGTFTWSANTMTFDGASDLAAGAEYTAKVSTAAKDKAGNALASETLWKFTTAAPAPAPTTKEAFPSSTTVVAGTVRSGDWSRLSADDNSYYEVNSSTSGTRAADWYGRIRGVSNALKSLKVTYRSKSSASCTQYVYVYQWTTGAWVRIDARTLGTSEIEVSVSPSGNLADYVSGTSGDGDVMIRVRCFRSDAVNFYTSADLLKVGFTT